VVRSFAFTSSAVILAVLWASVRPITADAQHPAGADPRLGLPFLAASDDRAGERSALGRKLFMDRRLSRNGTMSCGMCHVPEQGFTVNEVSTAVGIEGRTLRRNAPTLLNVGYNTSWFHDGRASTLEEQAWGPLLSADEMDNGSRGAVAEQLARLPDYAGLFEQAFTGSGPSPDTIGAALAAYQRSLVSGGSRFDRFFYKSEVGALTASERRGYVLFRGVAHCDACHTLEGGNTLFTDNKFHNLGVGLDKGDRSSQQVSVRLAAGVETKVPAALLDSMFRAPAGDAGRFEATGVEKDRFAYRTPTLRNIALTAPYMHDGSLVTLRDVVDFYDRGGNPNPGLDQLMMPLFLSERQKEDLVAFMRALTGANVEELARDARAAANTPSLR
jgi:cytochrome c peroxidase